MPRAKRAARQVSRSRNAPPANVPTLPPHLEGREIVTLILDWLRRSYVYQVSDRLLSTPNGPFDRTSNKTVVYVACDGYTSMTYTGAAFIGRTPTDEWIADFIRQERYSAVGKGAML